MLRRVVVTLTAVACLPILAVPTSATTGCYDPSAKLTVEEQRLDRNVGPELVKQAGLDKQVQAFTTSLCEQHGIGHARELAENAGQRLWQTAVRRAQHGNGDDRPLYWARLELTKAVRQWTLPRTSAQRSEVLTALDHAARGMDDVHFPKGTKRIMVSGFDPFQLDDDGIARGNPAGAAALALDGRVFSTHQGKVAIQAVSFPVLWGAFDEGIVEAAYGPHLRRDQLDGIVTISQGFPGKYTIERWAANWRGGSPDNDNASEKAAVPPADGWPQPAKQFIETTLPYEKMIKAAKGDYPVQYHQSFCEWPKGGDPDKDKPQCHETGEPSAGSTAEEGGGGNYLSNESMYRANRLRLGLNLSKLPGGHLHTPVLDPPANGKLTDPAFEAHRKAIVAETVSMIPAVAG